MTVGVGGQQLSPQVIYFGTEFRPADPSRWVVPIWAVGAAFFGNDRVNWLNLHYAINALARSGGLRAMELLSGGQATLR